MPTTSQLVADLIVSIAATEGQLAEVTDKLAAQQIVIDGLNATVTSLLAQIEELKKLIPVPPPTPPPVLVESKDGDSIPPLPQLVVGGKVWTSLGGVVFRDGSKFGFTQDVTELFAWQGKVYQQNAKKQGPWVASGVDVWTAAKDPRPVVAPAPVPSNGGGLIGAHHMDALSWSGKYPNQDLADQEARNWKAVGWDFVVFHMDEYGGDMTAGYPATLRSYYNACAKVGVRAAASWAWLNPPGQETVTQIVKDTKDHPAQWKIDGQCVYGAFDFPPFSEAALRDAGAWPAKMWPHVYFIPVGGQPGNKLHWTNDAAVVETTMNTYPWLYGMAVSGWQVSADQIVSSNRLVKQRASARGMKTMAALCPFYGSGGMMFDMQGYQLLETQWRGILADHPEAVWWLTSNDWQELSYVSPLPKSPIWSNNWNSADMADPLDHTGYTKFSEPFVAAYRAGVTTVTIPADRLFLSYQLHPKGAAPLAGSIEKMYGGRPWRDQLPDRIFLAAHLTAPAQLRINGQLSPQTFPSGIAHWDIPLAAGAAPSVAIVRNGNVVKSGVGPLPIEAKPARPSWNYLSVEV